jgi:hypothetical protein
MKKLFLLVCLLSLGSCVSSKKENQVSQNNETQSQNRMISSSNSDKFATISCSYQIYYVNDHDETKGHGISVENREGKWGIEYTNCTDGEIKYSVRMGQNKFLNLDFLADKGMGDRHDGAPGQLNLTCVGTDVKGIYKVGAFAGAGLFIGGRLGVFASLKGSQSVCIATDIKMGALGVELSPYSLEIR